MAAWLNIKVKLFIVLISVSMIPLALMGWFSLQESRTAISKEVFNHLISVRDGKRAQILRYFEKTQADIRVLAESPNIDVALDAFSSVMQEGVIDQRQFEYFESLEYGPSFRRFIKEYGYYDLMLITNQGDIVYSTKREADFSQNVLTGPLKDSLLGRFLERGLNEMVMTDFQLYAPSQNKAISFLIAPIGFGGGTVGVVVLKLTNEALNTIMLERSGMGDSGEAYLVGPDKLMRSDAYLDPQNRSVQASFLYPDKGRVDTLASREALAGKTGHQINTDYRGVSVLNAHLPVKIGEQTYALITEIDEVEAFSAIQNLQRLVQVLAGLVGSLMLVSAYFIANIVTRPILALTRSSIEIANGNLDQEVAISRNDELGVLAENFNNMRLSIRSIIQEIEENREELQRANETLEENVEKRTAELEVALGQAEQASAAKAEFLASMSHEIRTPMNGVVGMADLLSQTHLNEDQQLMLNTIKDSGNSLLTIINDILDFSKIEAGKLDIESIPLSLIDALEGAAATISPNASRKNIQIVTYIDPDIPHTLLGDPVRLRQIIFNLTGNAVKFSEEGEVTIRADKVREDGNGMRVKISVVDNGIGISDDAQSKLFEAFSQADNSTTRRFGGTGLGLTICKGLTDMMNGEISVESQLGSGSTFSVELPLALSDAGQAKTGDVDLSGVCFLMITESEMLGFSVKRYLEHLGVKTEVVSSEAEADEQILALKNENKFFDVIGCDFGLGENRQLGIVERFKSDNTRFLVLSDGQRRRARIQIPDMITLDGNPLRQSQLVNAVAVAVGRASPLVKQDVDGENTKAVEALSVDEALNQGTLILLAEDNITNQKVIERQLKVLGYTCEIADDGILALEAWRKREYCLLLTDCHMPNMDGFELTAAIRSDEVGTGKRAPIIAVTANALEGEAQRCIAGGMDDYLSKPLAMNDLKSMLKKWMPVSDSVSVETEYTPADDDKVSTTEAEMAGDDGNGPIDPSALKSVFGDDEETFKEILKDFIEPSKSNVEEIENAYAERSADGVAKASHKLKSSSRSVGANELADICTELEFAGKNNDWDKIVELVPRLPRVMQQVSSYIEKL